MTVAKPLPCSLPPLPAPIALGGVPDPSDEDRVIVTKDGLANLGGYLTATRAWIRAAAACLTVQP